MGTLGQKLDYLTDTKSILKQKINNLGGSLTDESTFRSYGDYLDELYDEMPKVTGEGTEITLNPTRKGRMQLDLKGNTNQTTRILPEGYTQLDYIESTGTQYIDTGIATSNTIKVETETINTFGFSRNNRTYGGTLFGGRLSSSNSNFSYVTGDLYDYVGNGNSFIEISKNTNTDLLKIQYDTSSIHIECGNYEYTNNNLSINITNSFNIYIFVNNQNNTIGSYGTYKVYKFKIYDNNVLVRDFIPCKNSTNEVGLYDLVSQTFFGNAGTGDFVAGNEVTIPNPDYPQPIHVVTGNNTVTVGNTNYPINLGSLELCKIGNYQDYLYKEDGNWYKYGVINKKILDGTETWNKSGDNTNVFIGKITLSHQIGLNYNSHFSVNLSGYVEKIDTSNSSTALYLGINKNRLTTSDASGLKEWLNNNNVELRYLLATPTTTQITDETLIAQLDAIENAMSTTGTTTITQTNADLPFIISASALKSFEEETEITSLTSGE